MRSQISSLALDLFRMSMWLIVLLAVFVPLERLFALHPRKVFRKSFASDLGYYFLTSLTPKLLLLYPLVLVGWLAHRIVPSGITAYTAALPIWARLIASIVIAEFGFYWGHRWSHEIPFLWRFHAIHHSAEDMDWLVSARAHPVDIVFTRLCGLIPLYILGLLQPLARSADVVTSLVLVLAGMWGFFIHSNVRWGLGPLKWLIATPAFHHWHHTYDGPIDKNFSPMLPWVDRIWGTHHMPKAQWPARYGTAHPVASTMSAQLVDPFHRVPLRPTSDLPMGHEQPSL